MRCSWRFLVPALAAAIHFRSVISVPTDTPRFIVAYAYGSGAGGPPKRIPNTGSFRPKKTQSSVKSRGGFDAEAEERSTTTTASSAESSPPPPSPPERRVPWLIVGGGIHGVHIAARLLGEGGVAKRGDVVIVDDRESLLDRWKTRTSSTGMRYLRSSAGYHLDLNEDSLRRFARIGFGGGGERDDRRETKKTKTKSRKANESRRRRRRQRPMNGGGGALFANDYARPELEFFNAHCDCVVEKFRLDEAHERGRAASIEPNEDHVRVTVAVSPPPSSSPTSDVDDDDPKNDASEQVVVYLAENLVLALGNDEPSYPDWATPEVLEVGAVRHLFDDRRVRNDDSPRGEEEGRSVAVIGGGISAVHKALELARGPDGDGAGAARRAPRSVHLICRHPIREQQFDTHQDWMLDDAAAARSRDAGGEGVPERRRRFDRATSWEERRRIISRERVSGTVSAALRRGRGGLERAVEQGDVTLHCGEVVACEPRRGGGDDDGGGRRSERRDFELVLSSGETMQVDEIVLATGFGKRPPGGKLVSDLVDRFGLEVSDFCGFPVVDGNLRWHPRIYASGALGELELGPAARNIAGARLAAERILEAARFQALSHKD